jgi:hypothetical protein
MGAPIYRHVTGLAALGALLAALPAAPAQAACTKATNIEAIIDDSGSMAATDPDLLRVRGMKLLIGSLSSGTMLGAIEFGGNFFASDPTPPADTLFKPEPIGPNATAMGTAMDNLIHADNGGTDYNAAFALSDSDNPSSDARIFLTDGGHDIGDYMNGHLNHKVPTYVIGFSQGILDQDKARLQQIATDTGGTYFPETDSSLLQSVMNQIGSDLTCQAPPRAFTDQLAAGKSVSHSIPISSKVKSAKIVLTWASPLDAFTISGFKIVNHGRTVAKAAKVRKLKVTRTTTDTYVVVQLSRLVKGTLRFKVKATKIGSGAPKATLTTQVSRQK